MVNIPRSSKISPKNSRSRYLEDTRISSKSSDRSRSGRKRSGSPIRHRSSDSVHTPGLQRPYTSAEVTKESKYVSVSAGLWEHSNTRSLSRTASRFRSGRERSRSPIVKRSADPIAPSILRFPSTSAVVRDECSHALTSPPGAPAEPLPLIELAVEPPPLIELAAISPHLIELAAVSPHLIELAAVSPNLIELVTVSPHLIELAAPAEPPPLIELAAEPPPLIAAPDILPHQIEAPAVPPPLIAAPGAPPLVAPLRPFGLDCIEVGRPYIDCDTDKKYCIEEDMNIYYSCRAVNIYVRIKILHSFADKDWDIGLIQAMAQHPFITFDSQYGEITYEMHQLSKGYYSMCCDTTAGKFSPFYYFGEGEDTSAYIRIKKGEVQAKSVELILRDEPSQSARRTFRVGGKEISITGGVDFRQFFVWVVALERGHLRENGSEIDKRRFQRNHDLMYTAYTISWHTADVFEVDLTKPLNAEGRIKITQDLGLDPPLIHDATDNVDIPLSAVIPPSCNSSSYVLWRPDVVKLRQLADGPNDEILQWAHVMIFDKTPSETVVPWEKFIEDITEGNEGIEVTANTSSADDANGIEWWRKFENVMDKMPDVKPLLKKRNRRINLTLDGTEVQMALDKIINRFDRRIPRVLHYPRTSEYKRLLLSNKEEIKNAMALIPPRMYITENNDEYRNPKQANWVLNNFADF